MDERTLQSVLGSTLAWRHGLAISLAIAGSLTAWAGADPAYLGTFASLGQGRVGGVRSVVLNVEAKGPYAQISGEARFNGKRTIEFKGTYYPKSSKLKGTLRELDGKKRLLSLDGRFLPEQAAFDIWPILPEGKGDTIHLRTLDVKQVEGDFSSDKASLSIRKKSGGFEVSGQLDGHSVSGSYYPQTNRLAARVEGMEPPSGSLTLDGHFHLTEKQLVFWVATKDASVLPGPIFKLSKGAMPKPPGPLQPETDPAAKPGAVWSEREKYRFSIGGTWTLQADGKTFKAKWANGAEATLTLVRIDSNSVEVSRDDLSGVSKGLKATYKGVRTGNKVSGTVDWTWADGTKGKGTWSADLPSKA